MHEILHPKRWRSSKGYANGILARGKQIYVGGQIGWNDEQVFEAHDLPGQVRQTLMNISAVLAEGGAKPEHLVRLTWYVTDKQLYLEHLKEVGRAYREVIGRHFPAMALVQVAGLVEDEALVEIEATAVVPEDAPPPSSE
jgi:enamine deaminase RidA (YjgF/YER057c/UK114 family)